jgi:hypothetical protein
MYEPGHGSKERLCERTNGLDLRLLPVLQSGVYVSMGFNRAKAA